MLPVYKLTKVFGLSSFARKTLCRIESCFIMLVETQNFLELDYHLVSQLLANSELHTTSEVEVFNSAIQWLKYDQRKNYTRNILLKVRLPLLSNPTLRYILKEFLPFADMNIYKDCVAMLQEVLENKIMFIQTNSGLNNTQQVLQSH